jgi:hypothetical protein
MNIAFGCDLKTIKAAQSDAAAICSAIAALCKSPDLNIEWHSQYCTLGVITANDQFPEIDVSIKLVGAKFRIAGLAIELADQARKAVDSGAGGV